MKRQQASVPLAVCGILAHTGNWVLNTLCNIALVLILAFAVYSIQDTWAIFQGAGVSDSVLRYKPTLTETVEAAPTMQELSALYPDLRAWLTLDDTKIDYPLLQGEDNSTYINRNIDGDFALSGEIFLDCQNTGDFTDLYNIVYGHHMELQAMFGGLDLFAQPSYLNEHTTGTLFLPDRTEQIEIFAFVSVDAYDTMIFTVNASDGANQAERLAYIKEVASVYREIDLSNCDRLIALSTCASSGTNARTIVLGRLTTLVAEAEQTEQTK